MNPSSDHPSAVIRSDIDATRRRMDNTMDALADRLQPHHLLDEVLGFFRGENDHGEDRLTQLREKISHSATTTMHSVVDTVKQNPMPALLIGAGVAWMLYASNRRPAPSSADGHYYGYDREVDPVRYDPDSHYDRPLQYPSGYTANEFGLEETAKPGTLKDTLAENAATAGGQFKEGLAQVGEAAREKASAFRARAGEMTARARAGTREAYDRTRQRVVTTAVRHPLEVGLVALAAGVIAGLVLPTPHAVNRTVGPVADRLRDRTREAGSEMLEKGRRVADAAISAVKSEAEAQGLTPEHLGKQVAAVGERAKDTVQQEARQEGLAPGSNQPASSPAI